MASLDEILQAKGGQPRDEQGRYTSATPAPEAREAPEPPEATSEKPETPEAKPTEPAKPAETPKVEQPAKTEPKPEESWTKAAVIEERRKRQEYERKVAEYEAELAKFKQQSATVPQNFWDNPEQFIRTEADRARAEALAAAQEQMRHQFADLCEMAARQRYPDYDEMRQVFLERAESDPVLKAEIARAPDVAEFAYQTAKRLRAMTEMADPESYKAKLREEIRKELEAELRQQRTAAVPQSLNAEPSPATSTQSWGGPTPLAAILKR